MTDHQTGEIRPIVVVTDNGGPFRSFRFEAFITARPELHHLRTGVRSFGQNGVRERAFGSLTYERLSREQIDDAPTSPVTPRRSASNSTKPDHMKRSPGSGPSTFTPAALTRQVRPSSTAKSCQLLDAGQSCQRGLTEQMLAGLAGRVVTVAFEQPVLVRSGAKVVYDGVRVFKPANQKGHRDG